MQRLISLISVAILVFFGQSTLNTAKASCTTLSQLDWILGTWQTQPDGNTQETWYKISEDTFSGIGSSRNSAGKLQQQESMRLVQMQSDLFYLAKVGHNSMPIPFRVTKCAENSVTFENPTHDFPNKLVYMRTKNKMHVAVSGFNNKGFDVHYQLASQD
ncbi:DUF6265 family protein [Aliiglaciecola lipolytica]|uniref:DUF6265 domain-containing protein n=1 Tax=Aliiglaciecola lipolytica E3 TaxID=1127673 RepID=K6X5M4_9ALTE|nr:DUF6265 family protein [Aliiglaciecola lipolytica]GAC15909.1 hypothetical protein GLIP_3295 [Aliiglaciecola lipolytica E3]